MCKDLEGEIDLGYSLWSQKRPRRGGASACEVEDGFEACAARERTLPKLSRRGWFLSL